MTKSELQAAYERAVLDRSVDRNRARDLEDQVRRLNEIIDIIGAVTGHRCYGGWSGGS